MSELLCYQTRKKIPSVAMWLLTIIMLFCIIYNFCVSWRSIGSNVILLISVIISATIGSANKENPWMCFWV